MWVPFFVGAYDKDWNILLVDWGRLLLWVLGFGEFRGGRTGGVEDFGLQD